MTRKRTKPSPASIAQNKKARFDYFIEEKIEAGLALEGWEVKSLRAGTAQLSESYVILKDSEIWLLGGHITPLSSASTHVSADASRTRKLLLHRDEIDRLAGLVERKGYTLVPLELYWSKDARNSQWASQKARNSTTSAPMRETATGSATKPERSKRS